MADINVERKRTSVWVWIVALIVAALLIWALAELFGGEEEPEPATVVEPVGTAPAGPPPIASGLRVS